MATVLKTVLAQANVGSNPTPSARLIVSCIVIRKKQAYRKYHEAKGAIYPMGSLQNLRNIGPALEAKLRLIGINTVGDFMKSKPEELYHGLQSVLGRPVDRCVLYCFLGARLDLPWHQCKRFFSVSNLNKGER
jgi:hypothetical protein